jgi:quercetin dioxygenase-like cupin family protein
MVESQMYFKLSRVTIPAAATVVYRGDHSMIYMLSGALTVTTANDKRALQQGEGTYLPPGIELTVQAGASAAAELLQYQLLRAPYSTTPAMNAPASAVELHQMNIPADALRAGPYELSMTRVTLPAGGSRVRPHTRSGAALYYVLSEGIITVWPSATIDELTGESRSEPRRAGAIQEEPYGFIHAWAPTADTPLVLLQANVSREGTPEIIFVK